MNPTLPNCHRVRVLSSRSPSSPGAPMPQCPPGRLIMATISWFCSKAQIPNRRIYKSHLIFATTVHILPLHSQFRDVIGNGTAQRLRSIHRSPFKTLSVSTFLRRVLQPHFLLFRVGHAQIMFAFTPQNVTTFLDSAKLNLSLVFSLMDCCVFVWCLEWSDVVWYLLTTHDSINMAFQNRQDVRLGWSGRAGVGLSWFSVSCKWIISVDYIFFVNLICVYMNVICVERMFLLSLC